jgi:ribA/ribD-fused uncharacterized protein
VNNQEWWDNVGPVLFWGGIYSQWYRAPFIVDGVKYRTAEHFMMAGKARLFGDDDSLEKIMGTSDPAEAKKLGRGIKGWDDKVWTAVRFQLVCRGSYEKFRQNPGLLQELLATGDREIVEASPYDKVWGVGLGEEEARRWYDDAMAAAAPDDKVLPWPGLNLLGKALMVARDMLAPQ